MEKIASFFIIVFAIPFFAGCGPTVKQTKTSRPRTAVPEVTTTRTTEYDKLAAILEGINVKDGVSKRDAAAIAQYTMMNYNLEGHYNINNPVIDSEDENEIVVKFSPLNPNSEVPMYRFEYRLRIDKESGSVVYSGIRK